MKYAPFLILCAILAGCATTPDGRKVYVGPTLNLQFGFAGATVGVGIQGASPAAIALPPPSK